MLSSALFGKLSAARSGPCHAARNSTGCATRICHIIRSRSRNSESVANLIFERFLSAGQLGRPELRFDNLYRSILAFDDKIGNCFGGTTSYPTQCSNFPCRCLCLNDFFASKSNSGLRIPRKPVTDSIPSRSRFHGKPVTDSTASRSGVAGGLNIAQEWGLSQSVLAAASFGGDGSVAG